MPFIPDDVDVFLTPSVIAPGRGGFGAMVHELGHSLGLSHPGDYNANGDEITYAHDRSFDEDTGLFSIMSYFEPSEYDKSVQWKLANIMTPMIYDILAIQQLYGADLTTRTGSTTYGFNVTADLVGSVYQFTNARTPVLTIWDAGGQDRIDVSGYGANQRIDLHEGTYSDVGGWTKNLGIAFHADIENAITGSGNDALTGNALGNLLSGNDGQDTLIGEAGDDNLFGGTGNDQLDGGSGNDSLYGGTGADSLIGGAGFDYIYYTSAAGENITLTPTGISSRGNWLVQGPAEGAGDVIQSSEGFVFGSGGDLITITRTPAGRALSVSGNAGNDTVVANGDEKDAYELIGGSGTDSIIVYGNSLFNAYGGQMRLGIWVESPKDNDRLTINHASFTSDFNFAIQGTVETSTFYRSANGSSARGFNTLSYIGSNANDYVDGMRGDDYFKGGGGTNRFYGYSGNDTMEGGDGRDDLNGGDGNDVIYGGDGPDFLYGGTGNDVIFTGMGGSGGFTYGMDGDDSITGSDDSEALFGGYGADLIYAAAGADQLNGDGGNDSLYGGGGDDLLFLVGICQQRAEGGLDKDELHVDRTGSTQDITFFLNGKAGNDGTITRGIELLFYNSGSGDDSIVGGSLGNNAIAGGRRQRYAGWQFCL